MKLKHKQVESTAKGDPVPLGRKKSQVVHIHSFLSFPSHSLKLTPTSQLLPLLQWKWYQQFFWSQTAISHWLTHAAFIQWVITSPADSTGCFLFICLPFVSVSTHLSIHPSAYPSIHPSFHPSICLSFVTSPSSVFSDTVLLHMYRKKGKLLFVVLLTISNLKLLIYSA